MKQLFILPLLLALMLSACSRNEVEKNLEWKETEAPENLVDVAFAGSLGAEVSTRAAFATGTPVTVRVYKRANAGTIDLTAAPYKTATGLTTGTGTDVADLSGISFTGGNITNGKLQVSKGSTYDFIVTVNEPATGITLTGSTLSGLPTGTKLLAGRATGVVVSTAALVTSVTVKCETAAGADSYGNLPQLTARLKLDISFSSAYINSLGIAGATVKVKSLTLKGINTKASLSFTGSPLALSGATTSGNYTYTATDNNSYTISSLNNGFTYDGGIYVLPSTAAATLNYDLVLTINGTDYTFSGSASMPAMLAGKAYTLEGSTFKMYNVVYDANGGTGTPAPQFKTWGTNLSITTTTPSRTGRSFLGWSTSSTATTASISTGVSVTDVNLGKSIYSSTSVTLYAVWSAQFVFMSHNGWAGCNIYWDNTYINGDGSKGRLTFDAVGDNTHSLYQGVYFLYGSLVALSPQGINWNTQAYSRGSTAAGTILYIPNPDKTTNGGWDPSVATNTAWGGIPYLSPSGNSKPYSYAYEKHDTIHNLGDICRYLTERGWAPPGKWRLPTAYEYENGGTQNATVCPSTGTFADISTSVNNNFGQYPIPVYRTSTATTGFGNTSAIFPMSGYRYVTTMSNVGNYGVFWTGSPYYGSPGYYGYLQTFYSPNGPYTGIYVSNAWPNGGAAVRCVKE